jgi:hypothetical protein
MTLIFVFDPLAVLMLIASNQGLAEWKAERKNRKGGSSSNGSGLDRFAERLVEKAIAKKDEVLQSVQEVKVSQKHDPDSDQMMSQIKAALAEVLPNKISVERMVERTASPAPIVEQAKEEIVQAEPLVDVVEKVEEAQDAVGQEPTEPKAAEHQEMIDTMRRVLFNAVENITIPTTVTLANESIDQEKEDEAAAQSPSEHDEHVTDTDDLLNKLQRVHAVRLQRFNARTI